jgi:hypothetical protein
MLRAERPPIPHLGAMRPSASKFRPREGSLSRATRILSGVAYRIYFDTEDHTHWIARATNGVVYEFPMGTRAWDQRRVYLGKRKGKRRLDEASARAAVGILGSQADPDVRIAED